MVTSSSQRRTELAVQRQRAAVVAGLHQSDADHPALLGPLQDVFHQAPADGGILHGRVHGHRANRSDGVTFGEEVVSDDAAVGNGNNRVDVGPGKKRVSTYPLCLDDIAQDC
jgi:hypothetical protein